MESNEFSSGVVKKTIEQPAQNEKEKNSSLKPGWIKMSQKEFEGAVVNFAKDGKTPAQIGLALRDQYGVPKAKLLGKGIIEILREKGIQYRSEDDTTKERVQKLKEHIARNKHDYPAFNSLTKKLWALHRAEKQTA